MRDVFEAAEFLLKERLAGKYSTPSDVRGFALSKCLNPDVLELLIFTGPIPPKPWDDETAEAVRLVGEVLGSRPKAATTGESPTMRED